MIWLKSERSHWRRFFGSSVEMMPLSLCKHPVNPARQFYVYIYKISRQSSKQLLKNELANDYVK